MAELSIFWTTGTTGDGTNPYTESQLFAWLRRTFNSDRASSGPLKGYNGELAVTAGTGSVTVGTGAAYVYGIPYENDAPLSVPIPTPTANTRRDRIVLRADWSAKTARITRLAGTEGAGAPNLTQNPGTIYEVPLALVTVTTSGTITVTDERQFCRFATEVTTENLADGAVTAAKIAGGPGSGVHADLLDNQHLADLDARYIRGQGAIVSLEEVWSIPSGTDTTISFDAEEFDVGDYFNPNVPNRLTCRANGVYLIWAQAEWGYAPSGVAYLQIKRNGTAVLAQSVHYLRSNQPLNQLTVCVWPLQTNDIIQMVVYQNSGQSVTLGPADGYLVNLGMIRLY